MRVVNVLEDRNYIDNLMESISTIKDQKHRNRNNYENFKDRLEEYDAFHVVVDDEDKILAMSGLYNGGIYPANTVRALDRTYYFSWNKGNSIYQTHNRYNTTYFWPEQYKIAEEKGYSNIFFSVQELRKRNAGAIVASRTVPEAKLLPHMYNTCRKYGEDNTLNTDMLCWQNVYLYQIKKDTFDLPCMEIEEYEKRYKNFATVR
tara:strand:+ start:1989 stop:2600 length:612 start_codon:yes stop_codon:yes gene_type:complete